MGSGIVRISLQIFSNFFEMLTLQQYEIAPHPGGVASGGGGVGGDGRGNAAYRFPYSLQDQGV